MRYRFYLYRNYKINNKKKWRISFKTSITKVEEMFYRIDSGPELHFKIATN